jgi:N-acetylmuramoyl-L-alanine amidase
MKILIDNGHGENTPGKRSPVWGDGTQLLEWEYAREIAARVESELKGHEVDVERLVKENTDISLSERARRANEIAARYGKSKTLLVSIHCNASQNGKGTGWEIHTSPGKTKADDLAQIFYDTANDMFGGTWKIRGDWSDGDGDWESNFYILTKTSCPSVLTENFFMDNEKDCKFLLSPEGKSQIVKLHVDAILKYIEKYE